MLWISSSDSKSESSGSVVVPSSIRSPSSFIIQFTSIVFLRQDCSFDSFSESRQLLL